MSDARCLGSNVIRRRSRSDSLAKGGRILERNLLYNNILLIKKYTALIRVSQSRVHCAGFDRVKDPLLSVYGPYNIPESLRPCVVQAVMGLPCDHVSM